MKQLKILVVGYSNMVKNTHIPLILKYPEVSIVGILRREVIEIGYKIYTYKELYNVLKSEKPDLVIISTPHSMHYEQVRSCLEFGANVYVEKPVALEFKQVEELVNLAKNKDKLLVVGLQRRYEGLAKIFEDYKEKVGKIKFIHGLFAHNMPVYENSWRNDYKLAGDGILDDSAFHIIDLMLFLSNNNLKKIEGSVLRRENRMAHSFSCIINTDDDTVISTSGSYMSPMNSVQEEVSIYGVNGSIFSRRFCIEWNTLPHPIYYKSNDGKDIETINLQKYPMGRQIPLDKMIQVLLEKENKDKLFSEAKNVMDTHKSVDILKKI